MHYPHYYTADMLVGWSVTLFLRGYGSTQLRSLIQIRKMQIWATTYAPSPVSTPLHEPSSASKLWCSRHRHSDKGGFNTRKLG